MVKRAVRGSERPLGGFRGQWEDQEDSWRVWEAREIVKRVVRGSMRPIGRSRGHLEGLGGQPEDLEASQRVWEASQGVWRVKLRGGVVETKKQRLRSPLCGTIGHRPLWGR